MLDHLLIFDNEVGNFSVHIYVSFLLIAIVGNFCIITTLVA